MTEPEQSLDGLYNQARSAFDGRNWAATIDRLRQIILRNPKYPGAQELLREAQKRQTAQIEYEIGLGYFNGKDWPQAIERFEAALRDDPDHADAEAKRIDAKRRLEIDRLLGEADKYRRGSQWGQVVVALKQASELDPGSEEIKRQLDDAEVEYLYQIGKRHFDSKHWRAASDSFDKLERRRPGYKDVPPKLQEIEKQLQLEKLYRQAQEHEQASEWSGAVDLYEQIYNKDPYYKRVLRRLTYCRKQLRLQEEKSPGEKRRDGKEHIRKPGEEPETEQRRNIPVMTHRTLKGTSSNKWWSCFAVGFTIAALVILLRARYLHCLLAYRTTEALISLILLLAGGVAGALASILADISPDVKKALRCILGGAACPILLFVLWAWAGFSPPPLEEECFSTPTVIPMPTTLTEVPASPTTQVATFTYTPTLTLADTFIPTYTATLISSLTPTPIITGTSTVTATLTRRPTPTLRYTATPAPTVTLTPSPTRRPNTPTPTATLTSTPTDTPKRPTPEDTPD